MGSLKVIEELYHFDQNYLHLLGHVKTLSDTIYHLTD